MICSRTPEAKNTQAETRTYFRDSSQIKRCYKKKYHEYQTDLCLGKKTVVVLLFLLIPHKKMSAKSEEF